MASFFCNKTVVLQESSQHTCSAQRLSKLYIIGWVNKSLAQVFVARLSHLTFANMLSIKLYLLPLLHNLCNLHFPFPFISNIHNPLEVVKVVGVLPAYPPTLMANLPHLLRHMWLLPGISTYQVGNSCAVHFWPLLYSS